MSGKLNIKFASLKGNLIIATDDAASHAKLSGDWPADAFTKGVKPIVKQAKDTARLIIIKGVELSIALDDDYVLSQLRDQHALSPTRIINKKTGQPTSLVKVTVADAPALLCVWFVTFIYINNYSIETCEYYKYAYLWHSVLISHQVLDKYIGE